MPESLVELIYVSSAAHPMAEEELIDILQVSRELNARDDITGMLVYSEMSFMQILEGPSVLVEALWQRLLADPRHHHVLRLSTHSLEDRAFENWSMGFSNVSRFDIESIPGCNDLFAEGRCLSNVDDGQAKNLLVAIRELTLRGDRRSKPL